VAVPFALIAMLGALDDPASTVLAGLAFAAVAGLAGFLLLEGGLRIARRFTGTLVRPDGLLVYQALGMKVLVRWGEIAGTDRVTYNGWRYLSIARTGGRGAVLMNLELDDPRAFHGRLEQVLPADNPLRDALDAIHDLAYEQ
jgi:hypothetical protein